MSSDDYTGPRLMDSSNQVVTSGELEACGWLEILQAVVDRECNQYVSPLLRASEQDQRAPRQAAALRCLAEVCAHYLRSDDEDEALGPLDRVDAWSDAQLDELRTFQGSVSDPELSARIADILWIRRRDRLAAEAAVVSYLASARHLEDPSSWSTGFFRLERALRIAVRLGKKNAPYLAVIAEMEAVLGRLAGTDPLYFSARLMGLLFDFHEGDAKTYAALASRMGASAALLQDGWRASAFHEAAAQWHARAGDAAGARASRVAAAECFAAMAEDRAAVAEFSVAARHLESAKRIAASGRSRCEPTPCCSKCRSISAKPWTSFKNSVLPSISRRMFGEQWTRCAISRPSLKPQSHSPPSRALRPYRQSARAWRSSVESSRCSS